MQNSTQNIISHTVEELEIVLVQEKEVLLGSRTNSLNDLIDKKNNLLTLLGDLNNKESKNVAAETLASINRCYLLNRENAQLLNHRLKITRQSLGLIREQVHASEVLLYNPDGKVRYKVASTNNLKV